MVVDKVEDAQACIDYLRKQNVGRASFMVLEKLSGIEKNVSQVKEVVVVSRSPLRDRDVF